jgi:hypothetical protein
MPARCESTLDALDDICRPSCKCGLIRPASVPAAKNFVEVNPWLWETGVQKAVSHMTDRFFSRPAYISSAPRFQ